MNRIASALTLLILGLLLAAYGALPADYWQTPGATTAHEPEGWSALEKRLAPEACAQCHSEQFDDWKQSLHAGAFSSGMIGQFPDMGREDANDCLNCHAPLVEQKFGGEREITAALALSLKQPRGFDADAVNDGVDKGRLPLRHAGVTCAACHLRGWQRFGPPGRDDGREGKIEAPAHGGFVADKAFEKSGFCASCHQFPQQYAINGKPMENTVSEWRQSRFAREGVECQSCHMPDRKHEFRGIHDPAMVRKGLTIESKASSRSASMSIASRWIGHAFPTYVTPRVVVTIAALDAHGKTVLARKWNIGRVVAYEDGWQELSDTRLMPGEMRMFTLDALPAGARRVRFTIDVIPDHFYKGVYSSLLDDGSRGDAGAHIRRASDNADANDYRLYEHETALLGSERQ